MLTSAGGILALLQDNPHVKEDSRTEDLKLKVRRVCETRILRVDYKYVQTSINVI